MKLYEVKRNTLFTLVDDDRIYNLHNIDGMYSYVTDAMNNVYHFAAWTEVEPYESNIRIQTVS